MKVTIDRRNVHGVLKDYPALIDVKLDALRHTAHGGSVQDKTGADIGFRSEHGDVLAREIESYDPATGALKAWVRIPSLSSESNTVLIVESGVSKAAKKSVWDENYKLVLRSDGWRDATANGNHGVRVKGDDRAVRVPHSAGLNFREALTVEAWVDSPAYQAERMQAVVTQWRHAEKFRMESFKMYDAGNTNGLVTRGFFGSIFDGRYVYFVPQYDGKDRHGKVLRYDTHGGFESPESWTGYDAGETGGMNTKGYYGAVYDGRHIYFVPRRDNAAPHTRVLRYDTQADFATAASWTAYDVGCNISYQGGAFDGRYVYFVPGYESSGATLTGKVLRYDTQGGFADPASYVLYDAGNTDGLATKCYDGAAFDGRFVYFAPLNDKGMMLRYDTTKGFTDSAAWGGFDASTVDGLKMHMCVGVTFDGRYMYYVPYASSVVVRFDTTGDFADARAWSAFDASNTSGLRTKGYDGAAFDGRYVYFIPFWDGADGSTGFHDRFLRYDTRGAFADAASWSAFDAEPVGTVGFNAGSFDGRYLYCAPWRESGPAGVMAAHGRVLRYDTAAPGAAFILNAVDFGHNGGLCGAVAGPSFILNTEQGALHVRASRNLGPGRHHLAATYDGQWLTLYVDGLPAGRQRGAGRIASGSLDVSVGKFLDGAGEFSGGIAEVRISNVARSAEWLATQYANQTAPASFARAGETR